MATPDQIKSVLGAVRRPQPATAPKPVTFTSASQENDADYVTVGTKGLVASASKVLAVSRGTLPPDDRDSIINKTVLTPAMLLKERMLLDSGKLRLGTLRRAAKSKSLKHLAPGHFDDWAQGFVVGHPLSSPLEEINPAHILEQCRRVTSMGPGGIGDEAAITASSQAVHPSQFGFFSTIEGPESSRCGIDKRLAYGVHYGSDGKLYQLMRNTKTGRSQWVSHTQAAQSIIKLPD